MEPRLKCAGQPTAASQCRGETYRRGDWPAVRGLREIHGRSEAE